MNAQAIARAYDAYCDRVLDLRDREDAAREAWIEQRADAIFDEILDANLADGATHEQVEEYAVIQARAEANTAAFYRNDEY
ncbi:hypothetical protein [Pararobbsia silviterrae]|uniref:Uncharacterized protein n=1 Tax=Pararobbsia silviterrae TaxID=1792498 RepID=A0A494Y2A0_9BURK|nr:hypothetical protein [Pararobbsia silviterrae]RKP56389.1 hypothetical protein D7S86_08310 [Pararobbsia silviterrae]